MYANVNESEQTHGAQSTSPVAKRRRAEAYEAGAAGAASTTTAASSSSSSTSSALAVEQSVPGTRQPHDTDESRFARTLTILRTTRSA